MPSKVDFSKIVGAVATKEDALLWLDEIQMVEDSLYKVGGEHALSAIRESSARLLEEVTKEGDKKGVLEELRKVLGSLNYVQLEVAKELSRGGVGRVKEWIESNVGKETKLDVVVNPSLVAGVRVIYKGRVYDYSINKWWPKGGAATS